MHREVVVSDHNTDWLLEIEQDERFEPLPKPPNAADNWIHAGGDRLRVDYFVDKQSRRLVGAARFGRRTQGHPKYAHGGAIAALADDVLGTTAWLSGRMISSLNISVDFRNYVPLGSLVRVDAEVTRVEGRKVWARCTIVSPPNTVHAEAEGLFLQVAETTGRE